MTDEHKNDLGVCGIVMPISPIDGLSEEHWGDVQEIISDAIQSAGFTPNLVSSADDIGVIQKRIIQNLYENPVVVCDVSAKNPNVMFELGIRLAFDKPTIIIKDDKTTYSFDTAPIEHLNYPRDLRFGEIVSFKQKLSERIQSTYQKSISDENFTPFLGHFGSFKVAKIDSKEVTPDTFIMEQLSEIRSLVISGRSARRHEFGDEEFGRPGADFTDFARAAKKAIRQFAKDRGVQVRQLASSDEELAQYVEREASAPNYFRRPTEFRFYLGVILSALQ